ncbi:alpha-ketoglutarate-dependent dioxygenase AlkB [Candidatus Poribacteria bacterium]|nr:alpha-ketoglutarate-dependent dioxygenase AlkB [Candidatus Poribacteria bacterium]MYA55164.1 alpha-ketoglutarate-dependent dioxygenase AlkB [Candidatus Poribacteria bacterium]
MDLQLKIDFQPDTQPLQPQPLEKQEIPTTIPGLRYIENYITAKRHDLLLTEVDTHPWLDDLKRRVQHYGFKYDYRARKVNHDMRIGKLPEWLKELSEKLLKDEYMPEVADQVIINEYLPGQGIASHIDCEPCFKGTISSLSLGAGCVMNFTHRYDRRTAQVWLEPGSLLVMSGEAREKWMHGITARRSDVWEGQTYPRGRRISLTFRNVIIS